MNIINHFRFTSLIPKIIDCFTYQLTFDPYHSRLFSVGRCCKYNLLYYPCSRTFSSDFNCISARFGTCSSPISNMKSALVLIVDGSEEIEFTVPVDLLRRAGVSVTLAGLNGASAVKCSNDMVIMPDVSLADAVKKGPYDAVILPGGVGHLKFIESDAVKNVLKEQEKAGRIIAAICAAPSVLAAHGILTGKKVTSYPSVKDKMKGYKYSEDKVVVDGNLVTSRGPGTAIEFALALVEKLTDAANVTKVKNAIIL